MAILLAALVVSSIQDCGGGSSSITNRYVVFILNEKIHLFSCATCIVKLSAGQKSKLQIVRCILRNKPIIMLDEPFANLDVTSKKQVADVLKEYANENVVLIATHDSIGGEIATQIIDINDMEDQGELKD